MLSGEATKKSERKILFTLAEAYAHLSAAVETLHPAARKSLPSFVREIGAASMMGEIQRWITLFGSEEGRLALYGAKILDELDVVVAASLFLKPFIAERMTIAEAMKVSDRLLLSRFFSKELRDVGFIDDLARKACHSAAILAAAANMVDDVTLSPLQILTTLLKDGGVRSYANVNEYQGIMWYTKEVMQEVIYLSSLSLHVAKGMQHPASYIQELLEKEGAAGYRLQQLLS